MLKKKITKKEESHFCDVKYDVIDKMINVVDGSARALAEPVTRMVVPEHQEPTGLTQVDGQLVVPFQVLAEAV